MNNKTHKEKNVIPIVSLVAIILVALIMIVSHILLKNNIKLNNFVNQNENADKTDSLINHKTNNALHKTWENTLASYDGNASIAVFYKKDNATYSYTNNYDKKDYYTASTCKVAVLTLLLHQRKGYLTDEEKNLATAMIEESDNDATDSLVSDLGGYEKLNELYHDLDMNYTHSDVHWGLTKTIPSDQLKLLNNIFYPSKYLNDSSRRYIQNLMGNIDISQNWGISSGSDAFYLKNGWLQDDDGKWIVNSIGYIPDDDNHDYTIAVYTNENDEMGTGENIIEDLAQDTKKVLQ